MPTPRLILRLALRPRRRIQAARISRVLLAAAAAPALVLTGCGDPGPSSEVLALGKEVYHRPASCVTCHQQGGLGVVNAFPPLRANPDLDAEDPTQLIKIVAHGLAGEIEAMGVTYNAPMAGLGGRLSPEEIAAVLTYVRSSWRNQGAPVTVDQVLAVQNAHPGRVEPWTVAELNGAPGASATALESGAAAPLAPLTPAALGDDTDVGTVPQPASVFARGQDLYLGAAQCASCHQPDGAGIPGAFPPLARSPWVTGSTQRLIKVALHGVAGEMTVNGETYNAEMPGQGSLLNDEEMAATLTYVRQAWGNAATPVYADQVAKLRTQFAGRHAPWPAEDLAKQDDRSPLTGLTFRRIEVPNDLKTIEGLDLDTLAVLKEGEIANGFITPHVIKTDAEQPKTVTLIFEADFEVHDEDQYTFALESSGSAVLYLDDERVMGRDKVRGHTTAIEKKLMSPGMHRLRLVSTIHGKWRMLKVSAQAPSVPRARHRMSHQATDALQVVDPSYLLVPGHDEPIVLRGRYEGQTKRGVGVGHPQRVNWAFDLGRGQLTRLWRGDFVNAAARLNGRNDKYMKPEGDQVIDLTKRPPLARLASPTDLWPDAGPDTTIPPGVASLGYQLRGQLPVFYTRVQGVLLIDAPAPDAIGPAAPRVRRTLDAYAAEPDPDLCVLLAEGQTIEPRGGGVFVVDDAHRVTLGNAPDARVVQQGGRALLVAPARWRPAAEGPPAWAAAEGTAPQHHAAWTVTYAWGG